MASHSLARQLSQVSDEWPNFPDELAVRKSFVFLKDNIIYEDLRDDLIQEGIVSEKEEDAYVCEKNNMRSKCERLIKLIIRKKRCKIFIEFMSRKSVFVAKTIIEARKQVAAETTKCVTRNPPFLVTDDLLQKHISCLHTQLEPREIADDMFQSGDITDRDHDTVTDPDRKYKRVTELLHIVKKRNLYSHFVYVLQSLKYFQVLEILEKDIKMTKKHYVGDIEPGRKLGLRSDKTAPEKVKPNDGILERFEQKYAHLNIRRLYLGSVQNEEKIVIAVVFDCDKNAITDADITSFENHSVISKQWEGEVLETSKIKLSKEAKSFKIDHETAEKIEKEISERSQKLMGAHSNLEIISGSCVKSRENGNHLSHIPCVVLYCSIKGIIPLGEDPFPTNIGEFPVDVREGFFFLSTNGNHFNQNSTVYDKLRMGCNIGTTDGRRSGSLGGFVALENGEIGFITCAHVLHGKLPIPKENLNMPFGVVQPGSMSHNICGNHVRSVCPYSKGPNAPTVDASLVKVVPHRRPNDCLFVELRPIIERNLGFDPDKLPTFCSGELRDLRSPIDKEHRFQPCFKVGSETGLTKGSLVLNGAVIRVAAARFERQPLNCNVYKLMEIEPSNEYFAEQGDSGALVFHVITSPPPERFVCIGMIIGIASTKNCYVMHIKEVLKELHLPNVESLYKFVVPMEVDNS